MSRSETPGAARFRAERAALAVAAAQQALAAAEAELRAAGGAPVPSAPSAAGINNAANPLMMQVMRDTPTDSAKYFTEGGMADVHQPGGPTSVTVVRDQSLPTPSPGPDRNGYFTDLPMTGPLG